MTPRLTDHARERCAEMGIGTKVVKQIVRHAELRYPGRETWTGGLTTVNVWRQQPEYAVVTLMGTHPPLVVTVLFNEPKDYVREGATYRVIEKVEG